jgi:hypothetical protein
LVLIGIADWIIPYAYGEHARDSREDAFFNREYCTAAATKLMQNTLLFRVRWAILSWRASEMLAGMSLALALAQMRQNLPANE